MLESLLADPEADVSYSDREGLSLLAVACRVTHSPGKVSASHVNTSCVRLLLARGAPLDQQDPRYGDTTALMTAAHNGLADVVRMLRDAGANRTLVNADGRTALQVARANATSGNPSPCAALALLAVDYLEEA